MGQAGYVGLACMVESLWADAAPASISRSEAQQDAFLRGIDSPAILRLLHERYTDAWFQLDVLGVFMAAGSNKEHGLYGLQGTMTRFQ